MGVEWILDTIKSKIDNPKYPAEYEQKFCLGLFVFIFDLCIILREFDIRI